MEINGVTLEFDILDADTAEKYERALREMEQEADSLDEQGDISLADNIRIQCRAIFDFFNTIFGEGTDKAIFGEKVNLGTCMDAYDQVVDTANRQRMQYENRIEKYYNAARAKR